MSDLLKIHCAVFLFGLSALFAKAVAVPVLTVVVGRTFFAAIALGAVLAWRRDALAVHLRRDLPLLLLGGVLAFHWWSFFYSIQISTLAVGLLSYSSFPMFVVILEPLFFRTRVSRTEMLMTLLIVLGLVLVVPDYDLGNQATIGALWGIASGFSFALLQVLNRRFVASEKPLRISFVQNLSAFLILLVVTRGEIGALSAFDFLLIVFLGVICTALAHTLFVSGLSTVRAQTASTIAALEPVYGIAFGLLLFGEAPSIRTLLGGAIILGTAMLASVRS